MPYIQNALSFTIETLVGLYLIAVILRFLFQLFRVDFRNPISQLIVTITNPPLKILRRFIPGVFGIDMASIVLIIIIGMIKTGLLLFVSGFEFNFPGALILAIAESLNIITWTLLIIILISAVLSWVAPRSYHPAVHLINQMSAPILKPFRRLLPAIQGIDLSPLLALFVLNLILRLVIHPLTDLGRQFFI